MNLFPGQPPQVAKQDHAGHPLACQPCEKLKGNSPVAGVQNISFKGQPVAEATVGSPLDQYHRPHVHLLVRCLDMADRPLQAQGPTSGIRHVLMATGVVESVDTDGFKRS